MDQSFALPGDHSPAANRSRRLLVGLYLVVTFLYFVALYIYMPTLPTYVADRADDLTLVGIILAQFGLLRQIHSRPSYAVRGHRLRPPRCATNG